MSLRHFLGTFAIVLVLTACTPAQQTGAGAASSPAAQIHTGPQKDPNFPPAFNAGAVPGMPIYWSAGNLTKPVVHFKNPPEDMEYLGFDDKGSMIRNMGTGKVYRWNFKENSLTVVANSYKEIPLDELASLKNAPQSVQYYLAQHGRGAQPAAVPEPQGMTSGSGPASGQIHKGPQHDPNLPPLIGPNNAPIYWTYGSDTVPSVEFRGYPFSKDPSNQSEASYLGFNENGSLILNRSNLKLYYWKLINPVSLAGTLTMTLAVKSYKDVPLDLLASLQNPSSTVQETLAANGKAPQPIAIPPQQAPPQNPDKSGGIFGDNPQKTLQNVAPAAGSPFEIAGKNASVQRGVLTFTLADGTKSKPYSVVRPAFMANAPQAAGVAGTWIATESGGKGIMFNVLGDNTVTGKEISPQVLQMLMQHAPKPQ